MRNVTCDDVVDALRSSTHVVSSPGCGAPTTLLDLIAARSSELKGLNLLSGLLLDGYPFLEAVEAGDITFGTWHVMPALRRPVAAGMVRFYPVRASQVPGLLASLPIDTALIRVSPPDRHGFCSLGPSVSYPRSAVRLADVVIAEIDPTMPRTRGESEIHVSEIDLAVPSETAMPAYARASSDDVSRAIAKQVISLLPDRPTIQIGIGSIPEAIVDELVAEQVGGLRFAGMATDGMADLYGAGLIDHREVTPYPPVMAAELMGSRTLMDFADDSPVVGVYSTQRGITASTLWDMNRFVTINSGLEIDRHGQVNSEWIDGRQISGVGGSIDFTESALHSVGGLRIIALASTNVRGATSKIVGSFAGGVPITVARHSVDYVVTEYGAVSIGFSSTQERAEKLAEIAHPDHRDEILEMGSAAHE